MAALRERLDQRRNSLIVEKSNYGARVGETIAGNLKRGTGGRFSSGGAATSSPTPARSETQQAAYDRGRQKVEDAAAATAAKKKPKAGSKGGKKGGKAPKKTTAQRQAEKKAEQAKNRSEVFQKLNIAPDGQAALESLRAGEQADPQAIARGGFEQAGIVEQAKDGSYHLTSTGRAMMNAADTGDLGRAGSSISSARDRTTARTDRQAAAAQKKTEVEAKRAKRQAEIAARRKARGLPVQKAAGLSVFKQTDGKWRWLSVSSTAFRDIDKETVTKQAMAADVEYADRTGDYGPLLWWHQPVELGICDFNALSGPLLIESGTFHHDWIGEAFSKKSHKLGMSIGFKRLPWEPGPDGLYTFIRRKERSMLPKIKAANQFTTLAVYKETTMDPEKIKQLAEYLNLSVDDTAAMVEKEVQRITAAANAQGLVEKAAGDVPAEDPMAQAADATVVEGSPDEEAAETTDEEAAEPDALAQAGGSLFSPEELGEIAQAVAPVVAAAVIEQLGPALNMETKLGKMVEEVKGLVGGMYNTTKEAGDAQETRITDLETKLKEATDKLAELSGDQPGTFNRPSFDPSNTLVGSVLKELVTKAQAAQVAGDPLDAVVDNILGFDRAAA